MLNNLSIKLRLILTMAFMGAMLIVGGAMGVFGLQTTNNTLQEVYTNQMPSSNAINLMMTRLLQARAALNRVAMRPDEASAEPTIKRAENFYTQSDEEWKKYLALPVVDNAEQKLSDEVTAKRLTYLQVGNQELAGALREHRIDEAEAILLNRMSPLFQDLTKSTDALIALQMENAAAGYEKSQSLFAKFRIAAIAGVLFGLVAVAISAFFLIRAINQPLQEMMVHFESIAAGDLTSNIEVKSKNEMGILMLGLQKMQSRLTATVSQVREGSTAISAATSQIAAGNLDLSSRTEEQASSLEETASSMEELTSTVKQNADNARQANQLAVSASAVAEKGGAVVSQVVDTMVSISESSKKIVDIIGVIDGIAFQTNILALNAAVEAARAGEQGRGFAVVASEVRNLAQRSAAAAKEIKGLIDSSVEKVDTGSKLVVEAGATMGEIVNSVKRVTDIMGEITSASQEQTAGIEQINQAITQMDEVTQQNAALVEEAAAASQALQDQANSLTQVVSVFKLDAIESNSKTSMLAAPKRQIKTATMANKSRLAIAKSHRPVQKPFTTANSDTNSEWEEF